MGVRMDFCNMSCGNIPSLSTIGLLFRWRRWQTPFPTWEYHEAHHLDFHQVGHRMGSLRLCTLQTVISHISLLALRCYQKTVLSYDKQNVRLIIRRWIHLCRCTFVQTIYTPLWSAPICPSTLIKERDHRVTVTGG